MYTLFRSVSCSVPKAVFTAANLRDLSNSTAVTANASACAASLVSGDVRFVTASVTSACLGEPTPLADHNSTVLRSTAVCYATTQRCEPRLCVQLGLKLLSASGIGALLLSPLTYLLPKPQFTKSRFDTLSSILWIAQSFAPRTSPSRRFSSS